MHPNFSNVKFNCIGTDCKQFSFVATALGLLSKEEIMACILIGVFDSYESGFNPVRQKLSMIRIGVGVVFKEIDCTSRPTFQ